jgi:hypothetical protein
MRWKTKRTNEFKKWWEALTRLEKRQVATSIEELRQTGPILGRPLVDSVNGSRYPNMKELRVTRTIRVFFAFDPRRMAVLLIGGDKTGRTARFYRQMILKADKAYDAHLRQINEEVLRDGR